MGVLAQLAEIYLKANRPADAERVAKRAVTFNKGEPGALMEARQRVRGRRQKFDDARAQFEAAYKLKSEGRDADLPDRADVRRSKTTFRWRVQTIDRALAIDPKNVQALVFKADSTPSSTTKPKPSPRTTMPSSRRRATTKRSQILVRKAGLLRR